MHLDAIIDELVSLRAAAPALRDAERDRYEDGLNAALLCIESTASMLDDVREVAEVDQALRFTTVRNPG